MIYVPSSPASTFNISSWRFLFTNVLKFDKLPDSRFQEITANGLPVISHWGNAYVVPRYVVTNFSGQEILGCSKI